jgi:hypothetical protein
MGSGRFTRRRSEKKEGEREFRTHTPPPLFLLAPWLYSATTNGLSPPTGWLGRSLYSLTLLTDYIIHSTSQSPVRLLFFYLILFAFVTGLTGLALPTNSLFVGGPTT